MSVLVEEDTFESRGPGFAPLGLVLSVQVEAYPMRAEDTFAGSSDWPQRSLPFNTSTKLPTCSLPRTRERERKNVSQKM